MPKESFLYPETREPFQTLEEITRRSKVSRAVAFENVLQACVASLAAETMEPEYFKAIAAHTKGNKGERGVDLFPVFLAQVVNIIEHTRNDVLGDLFQGAISYGENSLYLTPPAIAQMMAQMTVDEPTEDDNKDVMISDPCCGSGIPLIEAGKINPNAELVGQDIDARCAMITALNLSLHDKKGWVICGSTITREADFVYRIGHFYHEGPNGLRRGMIRQVPIDQCEVLPELQQSTKRNLLDTLNDESPSEPEPEHTLPKIIEIPEWILRIERSMTRIELSEQQQSQSTETTTEGVGKSSEDRSEPHKPSSKKNDNEDPKTQQTLF